LQVGDSPVACVDIADHDLEKMRVDAYVLSGDDDAELCATFGAWQDDVDPIPIQREISGQVDSIGTLDNSACDCQVAHTRIAAVTA